MSSVIGTDVEPEETGACRASQLLNQLQEAEDADDPEEMMRTLAMRFSRVESWPKPMEDGLSASPDSTTSQSKFRIASRLKTARFDQADVWKGTDEKVTIRQLPWDWQGKRRLLPPGKLPAWMDRWLSGITPWMPQSEQERLQTCYLYVSKDEDLCTPELIRFLATTRYRYVLGTLEAQAIINEAFNAVYPQYCMEIGCSFLRLMALMRVASYRTKGNWDGTGDMLVQLLCLLIVYGITVKDLMHHVFKACAMGLADYV
eukprot:4411223-Amphidinium_carterae.1